MAERIRVQGQPVDRSEEVAADSAKLAENGGLELELLSAAEITPAGRAGGESVTMDLDDKDVVEVRDADGWISWTTAGSLRERAAKKRSARVGGAIDLLEVLDVEQRVRGTREPREVRGFKVKLPSEILEQLDILDSLKGKLLTAAARPLVRAATGKVVAWAERPVADDAEDRDGKPKISGVYRVKNDLRLTGPDRLARDATLEESSDPHLVLIHGTFSNTEGGFLGLRGTEEWRDIVSGYEGRVAALEHKTLSVSPAVNALELARHLPANARLHLVTHSRGGLVGELLSLAAPGPKGSPSALDPKRFSRHDGEIAAAEREVLEQLVAELADRNATVERFVRVACPAGGTILASRQLDSLAGSLFNIISKIPGVSGWIFTILKTLTLTFLEQRTDPTVIPGIEAQMPSSPLVHLLNSSRHKRDDELAAIAGDVEPGRWLHWLVTKAADLFYREDHDFVVDTRSMYQGALRDNAVVSFDKGKDVNHFTYFSQEPSRRQVRSWLLHESGNPPKGFDPVDRDAAKLAKVKRGRATDADAPTVIVVPDFMGNALVEKGGEQVWPASHRLAEAGLGLLGRKVALKPAAPLADTYQGLLDCIEGDYRVVTFTYDWRSSLVDVAKELADAVEAALKANAHAVHLVAHGVGGLAVRLLQAHPVWTELRARHGRLLLLGCLDGGSYRSLQFATGDTDIAGKLCLLDPTRSKAQVARMFRSYPWVLETLPIQGDWWDESWWTGCSITWPPDKATLDAAHAVANDVEKARNNHGVIKIAGFGFVTPSDVECKSSGPVYSGVKDGDGVVSVDSATTSSDATYYVRASHGELASHPESLDGYADLLRSGLSHRLASEPEQVDTTSRSLSAGDECQLFPTSSDLEAAAVARESVAPRKGADREFVISVEVVHGNLGFAEFPVMVGHYDGSTIEGGEGQLDKQLKYRLTNRDVLGIYPGAIGSAEIVPNEPGKKPPGAIVIGMGEIGALNPAKVSRSVTEGALRHAIAALDVAKSANGAKGDESEEKSAPLSVGISSVLIGTSGISGLSIENSVEAIVRGVVAANRRLRERELIDDVRIDRIQIVELYEEIAIETVHATKQLDAHRCGGALDTCRVVPASRMAKIEGGKPGQPKSKYSRGEWRPIVIENVKTVIEDPSEPTEGSDRKAPRIREDLAFKSIGLLARAESTIHSSQRDQIKELIREAVGRRSPPKQIYNTLYELMVPNYLKGQTRESSNLLLVLDNKATTYPWEMLATRTGDNVEPLSVQTGMLRRLLTSSFSTRPQAIGNRALVIGDPPAGSKWPRLDGARREAETVRDRLSAGAAFEVDAIISPEPSDFDTSVHLQILNTLFQDEYRVLHIASHGDFNEEDPERSGAVIGEGAFLSPLVLHQLPAIPPLVFLNCCHLGRIAGQDDKDTGISALDGKFNDFAASVSQQLIRDGVRAVVAAGWAVDDDAAEMFADVFYQMMLEGHPFGDAVKRARRRIYDEFPGTNTWGAYQCYGDPGFKLVVRRPASGSGRSLVARTELLDRLGDLADDAKKSDGDQEHLAKQVRGLFATTPKDWHDGAVLSRAGAVLGELGEFEEAIDYYQRAVVGWAAKAPIGVLEQVANLSIRYALELSKAKEHDRAAIRKNVERASTRLRQLAGIGTTPERHALFGGHFRRFAVLGINRAKSIREAEHFYGEAHRLHLETAATDPYYGINWGVFRVLRGGLTEKDADWQAIEAVSIDAVAEARRREKARPEFWNRVAEPDAEVMLGLLHRNLDDRAGEIVKMYVAAFGKRSSERERGSVFDHLESLEAILKSKREKKMAADTAAIARKLKSWRDRTGR